MTKSFVPHQFNITISYIIKLHSSNSLSSMLVLPLLAVCLKIKPSQTSDTVMLRPSELQDTWIHDFDTPQCLTFDSISQQSCDLPNCICLGIFGTCHLAVVTSAQVLLEVISFLSNQLFLDYSFNALSIELSGRGTKLFSVKTGFDILPNHVTAEWSKLGNTFEVGGTISFPSQIQTDILAEINIHCIYITGARCSKL